MSIIWLVSYPGSGATRFRTFMANILRKAEQNLVSSFLPAAADRTLFREAVGYDASDLSEAEIAWIRPQVYDFYADASEEHLLYNIHDAFATNIGQVNIPLERTHSILYMIRNPLDVVVAIMESQDLCADKAIALLRDDQRHIGGNWDYPRASLRQHLGHWSHHVRNWVNMGRFDLEILRYEDLVTEPLLCFAEAADFMGLRIRASVLMDVLGDNGEAYQAMSRGLNTWQKQLSDAQVAEVISDHGRIMRALGYLDEQGIPVRDFS